MVCMCVCEGERPILLTMIRFINKYIYEYHFSKYRKITTLCFKLWCKNALNFEVHLLGRVSLFDGQ